MSINTTVLTQSPGLLTVVAVTGSYLLYSLGVAVYNLWFHPLSKVPGPRLAAATAWYETYFEIISGGGGMFTKEIKRMHEIYGPIVRINPSEVHIDDPEYHEKIYTNSNAYDKLKAWEGRFNMPTATFVTADATKHKIRRNALAPFFAPAKVRGHGPFIQSVVDHICHRLTTEYSGKSKILPLNDVFGCLTGDIITTLAFARSYHQIESEQWEAPFTTAVKKLASTSHIATQFQWFVPTLNLIPDSLLVRFAPAFKPIVDFRLEMDRQVQDIMSGKNNDVKEANHKTVFVELLNSRLPADEMTRERMGHEAISVVGAGFETSIWAMTVIAYYVLADPVVLETMRKELIEAMPDPNKILTWPELSQLPYLAGVVEEGLRLSYGVVQRSPRISRTHAFQYQTYTLPPGTPVSTDAFHMHHNERVFPDSYAFKPERWLNQPTGPDGVSPLSKYNVVFGKGTRVCLGMQIAYAEIYLAIATLFRRFEFELVDTGPEAVAFCRDMVTPQTRDPRKKVKVIVK